MQIKDTLIIMMNKKCEYECEDCLFDCSAESKLEIDQKKLLRTLDSLSGDIKRIHFSGGEPFNNYKLLKECVKIARRKNKIISCRTSCYWADDYETTLSFLKELKKDGLTHLIIDLNGINSRRDKVQNYKNVVDIAGDIRLKISFKITKTKGKMLGDEINLLGYRVLNKPINVNRSTKNMTLSELEEMYGKNNMTKAMVLETDCSFNWYSKGHFYSRIDEKDVEQLVKISQY